MNSHSRRLSSTAPLPERPATNSSKSGMQKVFWTSTASRQTRRSSSAAGPNPVPGRPGGRLAGALLVGHAPDLADAARVEMCRQRQVLHGGASLGAELLGGELNPVAHCDRLPG